MARRARRDPRLPSLDAEPGDRVAFDDVLLADEDGEV